MYVSPPKKSRGDLSLKWILLADWAPDSYPAASGGWAVLASIPAVSYKFAMARPHRIVIADRSELAANLYRLLLSPLGVNLIVRKKFEDAAPNFSGRERIDLGIINSNVFGKRFEEIFQGIEEVLPLARVKKIFICKDGDSEKEIRKRLKELKNSTVVTRPFHPDEFLKLVKRTIG